MKAMKKISAIIILVISSMLLFGCSKDEKEFNSSSKVEYDYNELSKEALKFIRNEDDNLGIGIDPRDIATNAKISSSYYSNNSFYLHIINNGINYIYRFQLVDNKVESYIKYSYMK